MKYSLIDQKIDPLFRENLSGLPQAFIQTCGFDSIRDDGNVLRQMARKDWREDYEEASTSLGFMASYFSTVCSSLM